MKTFKTIVENIEILEVYEITAEIKFFITANSEGDAGYNADNILDQLDSLGVDSSSYQLLSVDKVENSSTNESLNKFGKHIDKNEKNVFKIWNEIYENKQTSLLDKMEFYHKMRNAGYLPKTLEIINKF